MYVVDTTLMINDKASKSLNSLIAKVEQTNKAFMMLEKMVVNTEKALLSLNAASTTFGKAFTELNSGLSGANTRMGNTVKKADEAALSIQKLAAAGTEANVAFSSLNRNMQGVNAASRFGSASHTGSTRSGGHGGSSAHGFAGQISRLPGHLINKSIDAMIGMDIMKHMLEPGQEREMAMLRLKGTGMFNEGQQKQAQMLARQMIKDVPTSTMTGNIELINELATGLQSAKKGLELAPAMLRNASVMAFMSDEHGHADKGKAMAAGRILEQLGLQDAPTKQKEHVLDLITRASMSTKGMAGPEQMSHYLSMIGASRMGMNLDETFSVGSYMIQEFKNKAGSRMNAANRALNFGTMTQGGALGLMGGGLLPQQDVAGMKSPDIKRMVQGVDVKGNKVPGSGIGSGLFMRELLTQDIHAWTFKALEQILKTKKISPDQFKKFSHAEMQKLLLPIFGGINATGFDIVDTAFQQKHSIAEHIKNFNAAKTGESVADVQGAQASRVKALDAAWNDFWADFGTAPIVLKTVNELLTGTTNLVRGWGVNMDALNKAFPETQSAMSNFASEMPNFTAGLNQALKDAKPFFDTLSSWVINLGTFIGKFWLGPQNGAGSIFDFGAGKTPVSKSGSGAMLNSLINSPGYKGQKGNLVPPPPPTMPNIYGQVPGASSGATAAGPITIPITVPVHMPALKDALDGVLKDNMHKISGAVQKDLARGAMKHQNTTGPAGGNMNNPAFAGSN